VTDELVLIDWHPAGNVFTLTSYGKVGIYVETAEQAILSAKATAKFVALNEGMPVDRLGELLFQATFHNVALFDRKGARLVYSPVPESNVRYIGRDELGPMLPDGWFIEQQLNKYAGCLGDAITLQYRSSIKLAIADIQTFLAKRIVQTCEQLQESVDASAKYEQQLLDMN